MLLQKMVNTFIILGSKSVSIDNPVPTLGYVSAFVLEWSGLPVSHWRSLQRN